ncbi:glycine zipper domain-containing protein, partial [Microvirga sp. 2TAF3]|uniref:glycine zipper domain-containing protein n=1 Tax=Microvirga sp. 2TAF3 TaxID=3233014 RepID=UPI003F98D5D4
DDDDRAEAEGRVQTADLAGALAGALSGAQAGARNAKDPRSAAVGAIVGGVIGGLIGTFKDSPKIEPLNNEKVGEEEPQKEQVKDATNTILGGTTPGRATKGPTNQREKSGTYDDALRDFKQYEDLGFGKTKDINTAYGSGKVVEFPDGTKVTARPGSTDGSPTLEIRGPNGRGYEVRYRD